MMKKILLVLAGLFLIVLMAGAVFIYYFYHDVATEAGDRIDRGIIEGIIFSESPVYYDDGENIIGVFFDKTHRKYIEYRDIPPAFIKALIATEDRTFFTHPGFDAKAILRAVIANFRAGRVIQGGSTITQQTAKNVFKREKRSYQAKLKELMQAILLEKRYTKEEILEMYVNQFFVTGFGRGLRIAANYYFDKEVRDLDLVEIAFIAGSMKSPNRYNPFTKKTKAEKREAMRLSKLRKDFVLANMLEMKFISREEYEEAKAREVPFKEGRVTYRLNVVLDYIREQLDSDYFKAILQEQGIENIATSGIKIYTSLNKEIQEGALRSIRTHLPLVDVKLSGYSTNASTERYNELSDEGQKKGGTDLPFLCRIMEIHRDKNNPYLVVSWDGGSGIVDYDGLEPIGDAWIKSKTGPWATFDRRNVPEFMKLFHKGDVIVARMTDVPDSQSQTRLTLSQIPELEGGIIVLKQGAIKAMVGGFFDRFFNRAVDAKRQLGSIFKPIVYTAALQLNWNSLDPLVNLEDMFRFESTFYLPRPDHKPESDRVSMIWAGVKSENLASVWLLYHLTDQLNQSEFKKLTEILGLARRQDETYEEYASRIRDKYGIMVERENIMEAAFEEAKRDIESDLIFSGYAPALDNVRLLHYSLDVEQLSLSVPEDMQIYRLSYPRLQILNSEMRAKLTNVREIAADYVKNPQPMIEHAIYRELASFYYRMDENQDYTISYSSSGGERDLASLDRMPISGILEVIAKIPEDDVWIDGLLPSRTIDMLQSRTMELYEKWAALRKYDAEMLYRLSDFKRLVNLLYVTHLSGEMGITTKLDPVLSFPLGANSISILEAALAYDTIMTGRVYPIGEKLNLNMVPIITKIVDRQGKVIWEYSPQPREVLSSRTSELVTNILHLVIDNGTGRSAKDAVHMKVDIEGAKADIPIPCFGKTGTANRYTNSSFVGFIPGPKKGKSEVSLDEGYVAASYIGYDDNRPMKGSHVVIYGASGALPLWIETMNTIVNSSSYKKDLEIADLVFDLRSIRMATGERFVTLPVSPVSGLPVMGTNSERSPEVLADADLKAGVLHLKRTFEPFEGVLDEKDSKR
jgi:membrane peptidoglycan carboxypeptidase